MYLKNAGLKIWTWVVDRDIYQRDNKIQTRVQKKTCSDVIRGPSFAESSQLQVTKIIRSHDTTLYSGDEA